MTQLNPALPYIAAVRHLPYGPSSSPRGWGRSFWAKEKLRRLRVPEGFKTEVDKDGGWRQRNFDALTINYTR
jgi:hypothetical protein